jgi:(4-(4-[2-(gamma-L-glutamylamino)ethyl]phenoxymethyl)furan-2-yl)methanamine synthase
MTVLGLDVGGANLKTATTDKRAVSVPFALWKQPDQLPAALAALVDQFPDATELAVTMTGELCDCYETKRQGVNAILDAVEYAAKGRPVRVWSTDGTLIGTSASREDYMKVAAANWHATATYAAQFTTGPALMIDVGSTTTDVIPIANGAPCSQGKTDSERLAAGELVYTGVRRTPICALLGESVAAEFFATTKDAYLLLGRIDEAPNDADTADGRPATVRNAHARLSRMLGGDPELTSTDETRRLAEQIFSKQDDIIGDAAIRVADPILGSIHTVVTAGSGEFLAEAVTRHTLFEGAARISLSELLGPTVSACAPAYALAILATERRPSQ